MITAYSAGVVKYSNHISTEEWDPTYIRNTANEYLDITLNYLMVRL